MPPPHKNLLWILTISFRTHTGALKKEKKYRGRLDNTELMRVTLPPMERLLPFHKPSLFFKDSKMGDQVALRLGLAPTGIPRNRKGIESTSQCKNDDEARKKLSSRLTPYNLLL
jgi:hypothetical protein